MRRPQSSGSPDPAWLANARAALAAYDYDGARELLETRASGASLVTGGSWDGGGAPLLELLVDVLGLDADALALEPSSGLDVCR
jgi:hypothetical protein